MHSKFSGRQKIYFYTGWFDEGANNLIALTPVCNWYILEFRQYKTVKKIAFLVLVLAGTFAIGYKSHNIVRNKIYLPFRRGIGRGMIYTKYTQVLCPKDGIMLVTFGQSNSSNFVRPLLTDLMPDNLIQYDWRLGKCYEYKEPLLGAHGKEGNVVTYTAIKIANNTSRPVIVASFGVANTSVLDWAYTHLSYQQDIALSGMRESGLSPKVFLWHQGESDVRGKGANPDDLKNVLSFGSPIPQDYKLGLSKESYADALQKVVNKTKEYFPESHFGIALVSAGCSGGNRWDPVREAQREIAENNEGAFVSADSDKIYGNGMRYDNCHFSSQGAQELGNQYYSSISTLLE